MMEVERLVLLRHGETVGRSSVRFYGATDVLLSGLGTDQAAAAARAIGPEPFDIVVASPLQRAWRSACIVAPGRAIRLEAGFREIDFGRWEGLTREEIEAADPAGYAQWQARRSGFDFPGGERREAFRTRVIEGLYRWLACPVASMLIVAHKGSVRTMAEELVGAALGPDEPELAGVVELTRKAGRAWEIGGRARERASSE